MNVRHEHGSWGSCTDRMLQGVYKGELFRDHISQQGARQDILGFLRTFFRKRMLCCFTMRIALLVLRQTLDMSPALTCLDGERNYCGPLDILGISLYSKGPQNRDYRILGSMLGSPRFFDMLFRSFQTTESFQEGIRNAHMKALSLFAAPLTGTIAVIGWSVCLQPLSNSARSSHAKVCSTSEMRGSRSEKPFIRNRMLALQ